MRAIEADYRYTLYIVDGEPRLNYQPMSEVDKISIYRELARNYYEGRVVDSDLMIGDYIAEFAVPMLEATDSPLIHIFVNPGISSEEFQAKYGQQILEHKLLVRVLNISFWDEYDNFVDSPRYAMPYQHDFSQDSIYGPKDDGKKVEMRNLFLADRFGKAIMAGKYEMIESILNPNVVLSVNSEKCTVRGIAEVKTFFEYCVLKRSFLGGAFKNVSLVWVGNNWGFCIETSLGKRSFTLSQRSDGVNYIDEKSSYYKAITLKKCVFDKYDPLWISTLNFRIVFGSKEHRAFENLQDVMESLDSLKLKDGYILDGVKVGDFYGASVRLYARKETAKEKKNPETKEEALVFDGETILSGKIPYDIGELLPSVFGYLEMPFTEVAIWQAWLLHELPNSLPLDWHAMYRSRTIITSLPKLYNIKVAEIGKFLNDDSILPRVRIMDNMHALITYCFWSQWGGLFKSYVIVIRDGASVSFSKEFTENLYKYECGIEF